MLSRVYILILTKDIKFEVGDHVRISKQKKTFLQKVTLQIDQKKFL